MNKEAKNWVSKPTKKQMIGFTAVWLVGLFLLILSMTDLFRESLFQKKYVLLYLLILGSAVAIFKLHANYWKSRNESKI